MPSRVQEKVDWLAIEIQSLRARMQGKFNSVQSHKLEILEAIKSDYELSLERAREREKRDEVA